MVGYDRDGLARIGYCLSLAGGLTCTLSGMLLLRWLASPFLLGMLIIFAALLQRMTYRTLASILTVLFSIFDLLLWWLVSGDLSMVFSLQHLGFIGALLGITGGAISVFAIRTL